MRKERGHTRLGDGAHEVKFLFLAFERGFQKLIDLDAGGRLRGGAQGKHQPIAEIEHCQGGEYNRHHAP